MNTELSRARANALTISPCAEFMGPGLRRDDSVSYTVPIYEACARRARAAAIAAFSAS